MLRNNEVGDMCFIDFGCCERWTTYVDLVKSRLDWIRFILVHLRSLYLYIKIFSVSLYKEGCY